MLSLQYPRTNYPGCAALRTCPAFRELWLGRVEAGNLFEQELDMCGGEHHQDPFDEAVRREEETLEKVSDFLDGVDEAVVSELMRMLLMQ